MASLKVTTVGNSVGLILPRDLLAKLRVAKGDTLYVTETPNGIELTPFNPDSNWGTDTDTTAASSNSLPSILSPGFNPDFALQMDAAESIMRENRDALRKLAR